MTDYGFLTFGDPIPVLPGVRALHVETIGSTNAELMLAARSGLKGPFWLTSAEQTAGRGRRGRAWASPRGNLFASLLLTDPCPDDVLGQLPLVVSLALHDAVIAALPEDRRGLASIKWPNDILIGGAKCCGILMESERLKDGVRAVVIGCGLNIVAHPPDTPYPATNLAAEGSAIGPDAMFAQMARSFDMLLSAWDRGKNFQAIRSEWLAHAKGIGQSITVNLAQSTMEGLFEGIDADGLLLLRLPDGALKSISAGDVFLR